LGTDAQPDRAAATNPFRERLAITAGIEAITPETYHVQHYSFLQNCACRRAGGVYHRARPGEGALADIAGWRKGMSRTAAFYFTTLLDL
jgi:hypothetical protein